MTIARFITTFLIAVFCGANASAATRPRTIVPPLPEDLLYFWRFDDAAWWQPPHPFPLALENLSTIESWSGNALQMRGPGRALLHYPIADDAGHPLLTCDTGTLRFWFAPDWTSGDPASNTADTFGRLIEAGQWMKDASAGWWSLYFNPDHTAIYFSAQGERPFRPLDGADRAGADFLTAPIAWRAGEWHLVTLTYSPTQSALYIDGQLAAQGDGVSILPTDAELLKHGFTLGGDHDGGNLASGWFDDVATMDRVATPAEIAWYADAIPRFTRLTPVDVSGEKTKTAPVAFNPSFLASLQEPASENNPQSEIENPQLRGGGPMNMEGGSNCLWLEITLTPTNYALLTLHGTTPGTNYLILSSTNLPTSNWVIHAWLFTTNEQDWIETLVPLDRPTQFFHAGIGEDSDADGLPDVYEALVTGTDYEAGNGADSETSDGYSDSDGDGWTNLDEMRNRTAPNVFNEPPPPTYLYAYAPVGSAHVTLSWVVPGASAVTNIVAKRIGNGESVEIARVPGSQTSIVDPAPLPTDFRNTFYSVKTIYPNGESPWSYAVWVVNSSLTVVTANIISGPQNEPFIALAALQQDVAVVRFKKTGGTPPITPEFYDIPTNAFVHGICPAPPGLVPPYSSYSLESAGVEPNGNTGPYSPVNVSVSGYYLTNGGLAHTPFIDTTAFVDQNVATLLRAADGAAPAKWRFQLPNSPYPEYPDFREMFSFQDYASAGYQYTPALSYGFYRNEFEPMEANYFLRNIVYDPTRLETNGAPSIRATYTSWNGFQTATNIHSFFDVPPFVASGGTLPFSPQLEPSSSRWLYWGSSTRPGQNAIGLVPSSIRFQLQAGARNLYGLPLTSMKIAYQDTNFLLHTTTLYHGDQLLRAGTRPPYHFYPEYEQPILETIDHYFAARQSDVPAFYIDQVESHPGQLSFAASNTSPVLAAAVGVPGALGAWAKQRIVNGYTNAFAYSGRFFDKAFKADELGYPTTNETGILSEYGEFFPTEPGLAWLTLKPESASPPGFQPAGSIQPGQARVHAISIDADLNRDGTIDAAYGSPDKTSLGRPFRFWVNDDDDSGETEGTDIPRDGASDGAGLNLFSGTFTVDGVRDLIDFFPVRLNLQSLLLDFPPGPSNQYILSHAENALGFVYTTLHPDNPKGYLTDTNVAKALELSTSHRIRLWGVELDTNFLARVAHGTNGIILVEAWTPTTEPLVLEVRRNGVTIVRSKLHLIISDVEQMFRFKNLIQDVLPNSKDGRRDFLPSPRPSNEPETIDKNFVFLHGYNVSPDSARGWHAEMFKRLFWSGSRARFYGVAWRGYQSQLRIFGKSIFTPNYHTNVTFALKTGPRLDQFLDTLQGENVLAAHSMGNMVVCGALNDADAPVNTLFMLNAAIAIEALQGDAAMNTNMVHPEWLGYRTNLWASEWHKLFPAEDHRSTLTWRDRLSNLRNAQVFNFYSSSEEILRTHSGPLPITGNGMTEDILFFAAQQWLGNGIAPGTFAWAWQEKLKGRTALNNLLGSNHGGWGFSTNYYVIHYDLQGVPHWEPPYPSETGGITDADVRLFPFFKEERDKTLYTNGSSHAQIHRDTLLSSAFPSRTPAAGANSVPRFAPQGEPNRNLDMHAIFKNGWPASRDNLDWRHSDIREVAYLYVYPAFNSIVQLGNLK